jgi:hypothetical protein
VTVVVADERSNDRYVGEATSVGIALLVLAGLSRGPHGPGRSLAAGAAGATFPHADLRGSATALLTLFAAVVLLVLVGLALWAMPKMGG